MNNFFYFLAVLLIITLGSCEKDVKHDLEMDIAMEDPTKPTLDNRDISNLIPTAGSTPWHNDIPQNLPFICFQNGGFIVTELNPNFLPDTKFSDTPIKNSVVFPGHIKTIMTIEKIFSNDLRIHETIVFKSDQAIKEYEYDVNIDYIIDIECQYMDPINGYIIKRQEKFCLKKDNIIPACGNGVIASFRFYKENENEGSYRVFNSQNEKHFFKRNTGPGETQITSWMPEPPVIPNTDDG